MGASPDNEPLASPGNFFPGRKRRVTELFAELLGRSLLPFPHFAAVDHHIMRIALSLDLDLAKFDQSRFQYLNVPLAGAPRQGLRKQDNRGTGPSSYSSSYFCSCSTKISAAPISCPMRCQCVRQREGK